MLPEAATPGNAAGRGISVARVPMDATRVTLYVLRNTGAHVSLWPTMAHFSHKVSQDFDKWHTPLKAPAPDAFAHPAGIAARPRTPVAEL